MGTGAILQWAIGVGASPAIGVDVLHERVVSVPHSTVGGVGVVADGQRLPLGDGVADTVLCATLFSSLLDDEIAEALAMEIARVLRSGGLLLFYDFMRPNPGNPDVRAVPEPMVRRWFPYFEVDLHRVTLAPPLARRLLRHSNLARLAESVRPLRTHLAGALVKP